ncbi:hypothetical protein [Leuconostoc pseudomesenteroides]|uniref:hypothetical protein n=1 Tax=Leuconostoc pseudomesenteroides TaxID=33968 RepID=UPI00345EE1C1
MGTFLMSLWLLFSIAFLVTLLMLIINKIKKRKTKLTWKMPTAFFVAGFVSLLIGSSLMNSEDDSASVSSASPSKSSTKKNSSIDKKSLASSKAEAASESAKESSEIASSESASSASAASSKVASEAAKSSSKAAKSSSQAADKDPNSYQTGVTYDQVARTPDDYEGKKIQFTGRVIQVIEGDSETQIRLAVDGDSDNIILVAFDPDVLNGSRVLEDDLVTASGKSVGTVSYKSTMGGKITIPAMSAKIINDQGKASDDYGY